MKIQDLQRDKSFTARIDKMDKLNIVHAVKESPLRRQLSEQELLILIFRLANQENNIVAMTTTNRLRHRMLQWVRTGEWLNEYST
jgi:hypothetical protein